MGMAMFTNGASPRRREVMPTTAPVWSTRAAPPKAALYGATKSARSSMYSQEAAKERIDLTAPGVATSEPSSSMPTVPVTAPTVSPAELPRVAVGQGPEPSSDHTQPRLEIEPGDFGLHFRSVAQQHLDARGVDEQVAHGQSVARGVEDDPTPPALGAESEGRGPIGRHLDTNADDGGRHVLDVGRQRRRALGIDARGGRLRRRAEQRGETQEERDERSAPRHGYRLEYCCS